MASGYVVELSKKAEKERKKQDKTTQDRIDKAIGEIEKNPYPQDNNHVKKLKGQLKGKFRYDMSSFRIVYSVQEERLVVNVLTIGPRGDVYK